MGVKASAESSALCCNSFLPFPNKGGSDRQKENVLRREETDTMTSENIAQPQLTQSKLGLHGFVSVKYQ